LGASTRGRYVRGRKIRDEGEIEEEKIRKLKENGKKEKRKIRRRKGEFDCGMEGKKEMQVSFFIQMTKT